MIYLTHFLFAFIGLLIQSCYKINGINERTPKEASISFIINTYLRADFAKIALSFLFIFLEIVGLDIYSKLSPDTYLPFGLMEYQYAITKGANLVLPFVSFFSSTAILAGASKAEKLINAKFSDDAE